jgi:hypothetical protein
MTDRLIAITVQRRTIAVAVFDGLRLERALPHTLPSSELQAKNSAMLFLRRMLQTFPTNLVAVEVAPSNGTVRIKIQKHILTQLRSLSLPIQEVTEAEILSAYRVPALTSRMEMRCIASRILPVNSEGHLAQEALDAAIIGLCVQVDRSIRCDLDFNP